MSHRQWRGWQLRSIPFGIGTVTPVPQNTGQGVFVTASRCYYWLHTHVQDGVLHIESPTQTQCTLSQFFNIGTPSVPPQPVDWTKSQL